MTTLNSATASLNVRDCRNISVYIWLTAATTAPVCQLQGTMDNGASWINIGPTITGTASASVGVSATYNNIHFDAVRLIVSTAGSATTLNYVVLKGF